MTASLKVFIVDDSSLYRRTLVHAAEATGLVAELDTAPSGAIALKKIPGFQPDVVLLDIEMPDMNGIELLKILRAEYPRLMAILVSGATSRSADVTIEGLTSGASDFVAKPGGSDPARNVAELQGKLANVFRMVLSRLESRNARGAPAPAAPRPAVARPPGAVPTLIPPRIDAVGIGVSTGGPTALEALLPALPAGLKAPVLIVQHMPPLFTASLATALDRHSPLSVREATDGAVLRPGHAYLAPGGRHLKVELQARSGQAPELVARLDDGPPVNSCRPAVDVLFHSLAGTTQGRTLAVVMTGMGQDGLEGVQAIKGRMGYCLTQSEDTCTVYGMPQVVDRAGLSDEQVPLQHLAERITALTGTGAPLAK